MIAAEAAQKIETKNIEISINISLFIKNESCFIDLNILLFFYFISLITLNNEILTRNPRIKGYNLIL
jgi:hypothetical protein